MRQPGIGEEPRPGPCGPCRSGWPRPLNPGFAPPGFGSRVKFTRLAARQAYAGSEICAPRDGDIPDLRSRHPLALVVGRCRVLSEAREVVGKREDASPLGAVQPGGVAGASLLQFAAGVVGSVQAGIPLGFRGIGRGRVVRVCGAAASALRIPMMPSTHSEACRPPIPRHVVHRGGTAATRINLGTSIGRGVLSPPLLVDGIGCSRSPRTERSCSSGSSTRGTGASRRC